MQKRQKDKTEYEKKLYSLQKKQINLIKENRDILLFQIMHMSLDSVHSVLLLVHVSDLIGIIQTIKYVNACRSYRF